MKWVQYRLWKRGFGVMFEGRCHEYPVIDRCQRRAYLEDSAILHHADPSPTQENSNPRNLRIMLREWNETPSPRIAFYLANTYRDINDHANAVKWYEERLKTIAFQDEWLFAHLYMARSLRALGKQREADDVLCKAVIWGANWAELWMELAAGAYQQNRYDDAIAYCLKIDTYAPIPSTDLWREEQMYRDQPMRTASWAYEQKGDIPNAIVYAKLAIPLIGDADLAWSERLARLEQALSEVADVEARKLKIIALCRPGAIGDILMTLHTVPKLRQAHPDAQIWYFCSAAFIADTSLAPILRAAGVDRVLPFDTYNVWRMHVAKAINFVGYPLHEGYPERPMQQHLLQYFAKEAEVEAEPLTIARPVRPTFAPSGPYMTLQTKAGWSAYKQWPQERWDAVRAQLRDIPVVCIDESERHTLNECIAAVANATMHVGIDSFANHLTHYWWMDEAGARRTRGVILWGSTQHTAAGYNHNMNISKGLACQPCFRENPAISRMAKAPCQNGSKVYGDGLHQCMQEITVDEVVRAIRMMWRDEVGRAKYRVFGAAVAA
jgi:ADP-heptose:LPS heptosyltransferase